MVAAISHELEVETIEAKARWFQTLSLAERMEMLCFFTDLVFENNPSIAEQKDDKPSAGRVRILQPSRS